MWRFQAGTNFKAWLFGILRNVHLNIVREVGTRLALLSIDELVAESITVDEGPDPVAAQVIERADLVRPSSCPRRRSITSGTALAARADPSPCAPVIEASPGRRAPGGCHPRVARDPVGSWTHARGRRSGRRSGRRAGSGRSDRRRIVPLFAFGPRAGGRQCRRATAPDPTRPTRLRLGSGARRRRAAPSRDPAQRDAGRRGRGWTRSPRLTA